VKIEEAYKESKQTGKPIMANFTGSDWCGWCKRLTASVFSKPEFKSWAEDNVVLLELDFPRRTQLPNDIRQQNYSLQQAFKVRGYPTIWVFHLDKNEQGQFAIQALGRTGYTPTVEQFTSGVDQMIARADKGE
jgi:thiol:disulfide interchange protein